MIKTGTYLNDDANKHQHAKRTDDGGVILSEFTSETQANQITLDANATKALAGVIAPPMQNPERREIWVQGYVHLWNRLHDTTPIPLDKAQREAMARYPDPVRPREKTIDGTKYRVINGVVEYYSPACGVWCRSTHTAERVTVLASLLASPTEVVNDG